MRSFKSLVEVVALTVWALNQKQRMAPGDIRSARADAEAATPRSQLLTVRELADHLRVHRSTIYRLLRQHRIPGFRINGDWRFDREQIERWIRSKTKAE